jgi:DNA-binding protein H-NS
LLDSSHFYVMAKNLKQVLAQINSLQKQADQLRKKEVSGVIERIKEAIEHYGLTAEDLFGARRTNRTGSARPAKAAKVVKPMATRKKKSPISFPMYGLDGKTWTGQGRRPKWFVEALAAGKRPEDMQLQEFLDAKPK